MGFHIGILSYEIQENPDGIIKNLNEKINTANESKLSTWEKMGEATGQLLANAKDVSTAKHDDTKFGYACSCGLQLNL